MLDDIDLKTVVIVLGKVVAQEPIAKRERQLLLDYLEEFPGGVFYDAAKGALKVCTVKADDPMPSAEELKEEIAEADIEREESRKAQKKARKKKQ